MTVLLFVKDYIRLKLGCEQPLKLYVRLRMCVIHVLRQFDEDNPTHEEEILTELMI